MKKNLDELEQQAFVEDDFAEVPPSDIIAYNELRSCADLFRMHTQGILEIQPEFQREFVWKNPDKTRFIDSLIKQLPIPSMCFSLDYKTQKWQVIDGLQRMATIVGFLSGSIDRMSDLKDIDPGIKGQLYSKFIDENSNLHSYYIRVENLTLPITVLRCDYSKKNHMNYLFTIFHRLNAGGMKLNNQEIRNCIFSGPFNNLLKELNENKKWIKINRIKSNIGYRFRTQELILRFFAFHDNHKNYGGKLATFLNDYMDDNKQLDPNALANKKEMFNRTIDVAYKKIFEGQIPTKLSITVLEALLVGISFNLDYLESKSPSHAMELHKKLLSHEEFSEQKLGEGLSGKTRVLGRILAAKSILAGK